MTLFVGLDIGSKFHVAAFLPADEDSKDWKKLPTCRVENNATDYTHFKIVVEGYGHNNVIVAMEPTGMAYSQTIATYCKENGWEVAWVENKALSDYRSMLRSPNKSDDMDARLLAHYAWKGNHTFKDRAKEGKDLLYLTQELKALNKQRTRYKNRILQSLKVTFPELKIGEGIKILRLLEMAPTAKTITVTELAKIQAIMGPKKGIEVYELAHQSIGCDDAAIAGRLTRDLKMLKAHDEMILDIKNQIEVAVLKHPDAEILLSMPGVGYTSAACIIGTYDNILLYTNKRSFMRRLGVSPETKQSGIVLNRTFINRRSNTYARTALHLVAVAALSPTVGPNGFKTYFAYRRRDGVKGHNRRLFGRLKGKIAEVLYQLLKSRQCYRASEHRILLPADMLGV